MKGSGFGVIGDLILGVIGSIVGGWVAGLIFGVDMVTGLNLTTLVVSVIGAVIVVFLVGLVKRR
jgi:uncharacterized membrane protein YeaQ/YmgE (transglycosylase-associated protein family)